MKLNEIKIGTFDTGNNEENADGFLDSRLAMNGEVQSDGRINCQYAEINEHTLKEYNIINNRGELMVRYGHIDEDFSVRRVPNLRTLKGMPEFVDEIALYDIPELEELDYFPKDVHRCYINNVNLRSLEGPLRESTIGTFSLSRLFNLTSLKGLPHKMSNNLIIHHCGNAKDILQIFKTKGISEIMFTLNTGKDTDDKAIEEILNRNYKNDRDMIQCQEDLIDAGFKEWARLK